MSTDTPISITTFSLRPIKTNCYLISSGSSAIIIDPGLDALAYCKKKIEHLTVEAILLTHSHWDHRAGLAELAHATKAPVYIHFSEKRYVENPLEDPLATPISIAPCPVTSTFQNNDILHIGPFQIKVWHTPGHSPGCCVFFIQDVLFTGDTLFANGFGRVDLPGSNPIEMDQSLHRLMSLDPNLKIYPGHGPSATIQESFSMLNLDDY